MIDYSDAIKTERMGVVRDALAGGRMELLQDKFLLARIPLGNGTVEGAELSFAVSEGAAMLGGTPTAARLLDYYGRIAAEGLVVGVDVLMDDENISAGQTVRVLSCVIRHR